MQLFGFEIRRIPKPVVISAYDRLCLAVDEINAAWRTIEVRGNTIRPWIIWEEKKVVLTDRKGSIEVVYEK